MHLYLNATETNEIPNKKEEGTSLEPEGADRASALARIKQKSWRLGLVILEVFSNLDGSMI